MLKRRATWPRGVPVSDLCAFIASILSSTLEPRCVVNIHEIIHCGVIRSDSKLSDMRRDASHVPWM